MEKIKGILKIGLLHVLGAYSINQIIVFLTNIVVVRFLTKADYGYYGSALNIYTIVLLFSGFGILSGQLLYCSEDRSKDEKRSIYKHSFYGGILIEIFLCFFMIVYAFGGPVGMEEARRYIIMFSGLPILEFVMQFILTYYRTQCDNKKYSYLMVSNSILLLLFTGIGVIISGVEGVIISQYLAFICISILGVYFEKKEFAKIIKASRISKELRKSLWTYSIKDGASGALNQILYLLDVTFISTIIAEPEIIANYKLATLIPNGLRFIPGSIAIAVIPHYIKNMADSEWLKKTTKNIFWGTFVLNLTITVVLIVGAPFIICLLWGEKYLVSVDYFRVLSLSYFFLATFRFFSTNILSIFRKTTFNLVVAIVTVVSNMILNYIMIMKYSAMGAAWATLISVLIASVLSFPYLIKEIYYRK